MHFEKIDIGQTHIRLTSDCQNHYLRSFINSIRLQLQSYIITNPDFSLSLEPLKCDEEGLPEIIELMYESSTYADVGPMACVAGTISELSLKYLMELGSDYSIVENGGDIALVNDKRVLCGIYSNNSLLENRIAFEIKPRKKPLGICTSSGKIGHSISFGKSDSVTVISKSPSLADGLATRIANEVKGQTSEDKVVSACECGENYREFFQGVLIVCDNHVASIGNLPDIVETDEFHLDF